MQPSVFTSGQYSCYMLNHFSVCVIVMIAASAVTQINFFVVALHAVIHTIFYLRQEIRYVFNANLILGMHSLWLFPHPWDCFMLCYLSLKKIKNLLKNKLPCSSVADPKAWFLIKLSLHNAKVQLIGHNVYSEALLGSSACTSTYKTER